MNKQIVFTGTGHKHQILGMQISNFLPNKHTQAIGHFVFLDYNPAKVYKPQKPRAPDGSFAHPHRGIATFTYVTHGEFEHYDSMGHHETVAEGGAQWMKAGNGIVHDEDFSQSFQQRGGMGGGLQFWINLPADVKKEDPEYMPLQATDFHKIMLPGDAGFLKILIGTYEDKTSKVKTYADQLMYHLQLNPGKEFLLNANSNFDYAAFTITGNLRIINTEFSEGNLIVFGGEGDAIKLENHSSQPADIILFGGEPYTENIVAQGPFVMNSRQEIAEAYVDYKAGRYGTIKYQLEEKFNLIDQPTA
ncbi:MAG: pirin family protein [Chitinophagaceae bacterium]|nr:pirin family protein [Chitinophagaceae bacterium]